MIPLADAVREALRTVQDPDLHKDLVTLNMVKQIEVTDEGLAKVRIELTTPACPMREKIRQEAEEAVLHVPGIRAAEIELTASVRATNPGAGKVRISGVKNIIAVGSGKGGVGKSTTSVNLAYALARLGAKVAILDADIYGPNLPAMVGAEGRPRVIQNRIIPLVADGVTVMSMGFMLNVDQPLVWRGPMLHGVIKQLLHDVDWGEQDYMVVDLPPGTGDVQLTLTQSVPLTGAVIVTTPQNIALQDARKAIVMFQNTNVPILGLVENMSYYVCPKCGHRDDIFDTRGGENAARKHAVPFLGRLPLDTSIREAMDTGRPVAANPDSVFGKAYREIAEKLAQQVSILNSRTPVPSTV